MRKVLLPVLAAAIFAAVPAQAGQVTIEVSAQGLDLSHASDIVEMKERIDVAVAKACTRPSPAAPIGHEAVEECIADGTAKALAALDTKLAQN